MPRTSTKTPVDPPVPSALHPCLCGCGARVPLEFAHGHGRRYAAQLVNLALNGKAREAAKATKELRERGWLASLERSRAAQIRREMLDGHNDRPPRQSRPPATRTAKPKPTAKTSTSRPVPKPSPEPAPKPAAKRTRTRTRKTTGTTGTESDIVMAHEVVRKASAAS